MSTADPGDRALCPHPAPRNLDGAPEAPGRVSGSPGPSEPAVRETAARWAAERAPRRARTDSCETPMAEHTSAGPVPPGTHRGAAPSGPPEPIRAAGAVLCREGRGTREVALVHQPRHGGWTLPSARLEHGEHPLAVAQRDVCEETGVRPVLGRRLLSRCYLSGGWPKRVEWWAATPDTEPSLSPGGEADQAAWFPLAEALQRVSYRHDAHVLDDIDTTPPDTYPVILLHNASSHDSEWNGDELLRPLDESGRVDAHALAGILAAFGTPRVVSSAAARCAETVSPYARKHGVRVRTDRALTRHTRPGDSEPVSSEQARAAFARLLADGLPTLVCTHGELVQDLMREALTRLGAPISQRLGLRPGEFWILHVAAADRTLAAVERHTAAG